MRNTRVPAGIGAYDHALASERPAGTLEARLDRLAARLPFAWYAAWAWVRRQYDDMPGPWWVKLPALAVLLVTPGPDELLVFALPKIGRAVREWRERRGSK